MKRLLLISILLLLFAGLANSQPTVQLTAESNVDKLPLLDVKQVYLQDSNDYALMSEGPMVDIGYAKVTPHRSTGSHNTFTSGDFSHKGYHNLVDFLQGRVPGLRVTQSGMNRYSMQIRGPSSIHMNTEPLLVFNGMPMQSNEMLYYLHPNDVKSLTILKGPEAAIYGVRGSNGVILVNTH